MCCFWKRNICEKRDWSQPLIKGFVFLEWFLLPFGFNGLSVFNIRYFEGGFLFRTAFRRHLAVIYYWLVRSSKCSIINALFWLFELLLGGYSPLVMKRAGFENLNNGDWIAFCLLKLFCLDIFDQLVGFYENNYSSQAHGLWVNTPFGLRPNGLLTQSPFWLEE